MAAVYIKILKSYANFTNVFRGTYESQWLLLFHDHFYCLDNPYAAGDAVPSAREIKIHGSEFKFFVSIFRKLEKIIT